MLYFGVLVAKIATRSVYNTSMLMLYIINQWKDMVDVFCEQGQNQDLKLRREEV